MNHFIRFLLFLFFLTLYQARGDDLNYFSGGIDYWGNGKKN